MIREYWFHSGFGDIIILVCLRYNRDLSYTIINPRADGSNTCRFLHSAVVRLPSSTKWSFFIYKVMHLILWERPVSHTVLSSGRWRASVEGIRDTVWTTRSRHASGSAGPGGWGGDCPGLECAEGLDLSVSSWSVCGEPACFPSLCCGNERADSCDGLEGEEELSLTCLTKTESLVTALLVISHGTKNRLANLLVAWSLPTLGSCFPSISSPGTWSYLFFHIFSISFTVFFIFFL